MSHLYDILITGRKFRFMTNSRCTYCS